MSDFDNNLKKALNGEVRPDPGKIDEMREQTAKTFKQRLWLAGYMYVIFEIFCVAVLVFAFYQYLRVVDVKEMLLMALLILIMFECTVLMKLWFWGFRQHVGTIREIKRLQFRVEDLAMNRQSDSSIESLGDLGSVDSSLPFGRWGKPYAAFLTVLLLACAYILFKPVFDSRGFSSDFVGRQIDEWHIVDPETVEAHSKLTVTSWPGDPAVLTIQLPYEKGKLKSVTCADEEVVFHGFGAGRYELDLPGGWLELKEKTFEVVWELPLDLLATHSLGRRSTYRTDLKTLIPSHRYSLKVVLEEGCGFSIEGHTDATEAPLFSQSRSYPFTINYGSCGMPLERRTEDVKATEDTEEIQSATETPWISGEGTEKENRVRR